MNSMNSLFDDSIECMDRLGSKFAASRKKLEDLEARLQEGRFHLAVLGQFKRGKSTFLNALLGDVLLPSSVLPLTAVPTCISFGNSPLVRALNEEGTVKEEILGKEQKEIAAFLARYVTEEFNPNNRLGIAQVEVFHQAPILSKGVVLVDTPGIGSTYRHNTEATLAFLPQCDAALFLISADPPISEVELDFLRKVMTRVPKLFFILNKVDYLTEAEKQSSVQFFKKILHEQACIDEKTLLFCVSARRGVSARMAHDEKGWIESGMAEVEEHLIEFLVKDKNETLQKALSRKAEDILSDVLMQIQLAMRTLQMPLEKLEECRRIFEEKINAAEHQRVVAGDMLRGDRKRSLEFLENQSLALREKAGTYLEARLEEVLKGHPDMNRARKTMSDVIPTFFEEELRDMSGIFDAHVHETLNPHQKQADELIEAVRKAAAELFDIPYHAPKSSDAFEMTREPYWKTSEERTFFNPIPESLMLQMLPPKVRRSRIRKRMQEDLESLVLANLENLRWATLQNLDRAFRNFSSLLDKRMSDTIQATHGAIQAACTKRSEQSDAVAAELARLAGAAGKIGALREKFRKRRVG
jgi:GTP-binding protein EngB required for normal cell division